MHLVMIVNKHTTKYRGIQAPSLSEVVERDRFLARGNSSFVSSRQSGLTSINRSKVILLNLLSEEKALRSLMVKFMKGN